MKKILVADDSVTIQKVIALTFAEEPYEIQSVGSGSDALEKMKQWPPDLVLADVIMPQVNGYELCRAIKENEETKDIPVILLAGTFEAFDEEEARAAGANDYLTKPFESAELIEKVRNLTGPVVAAPPSDTPAPPEPAIPGPEPAAAPGQESPPILETVPPMAAVGTEGKPQQPIQAREAVSEPDIWDILSEADDQVTAEPSSPSIGLLEEAEVVDFGTFEVGLDRGTEAAVDQSEPVPSPDEIQAGEPSMILQEDTAVVVEEERSKVEERERDFFGFETEAEIIPPELGTMEEAIEEITFEVEEPDAPAQPEAIIPPEPSIVLPEPAEQSPEPSGETVSPETYAPSEPEVQLDVPGPAAEHLEMGEGIQEAGIELQESPSVPTTLSAVEQPAAEVLPMEPDQPSEPEEKWDVPLTVEPPGVEEVPVVSESSDEVAPEIPEVPQPVGVTEPQPAAADTREISVDDRQLEDLVKKAVEERVERIVWEVVPELSEVLIKEAIEKIRSGS